VFAFGFETRIKKIWPLINRLINEVIWRRNNTLSGCQRVLTKRPRCNQMLFQLI